MAFKDTLNEIMEKVPCTAKELSEASGLSPAVISRYRTGARTPAQDGGQLERLAAGLAALAAARGREDMTREAVEAALAEAVRQETEPVDAREYSRRLDELLDSFGVTNNELARALNFDASYFSRILSGQRTPADPAAFGGNVGAYLARRCREEGERRRLYELMGGALPEAWDENACARDVEAYLCSRAAGTTGGGNIDGFLRKLDEFDLDEYIRVIRFDELKTPTAPIQLAVSRSYDGLREMMDGQLDFLRHTVLSRSTGAVTMYSDLPMEEMSRDPEFPKKWMFGMAMMLKKGLRLQMIHQVERPFREMMLGLESYIPMYMTGQIDPYYLPGYQTGPFRQLLWTSGAAALTGECIAGNLREGRERLTTRKADLAYYARRSEQLLRRAQPLMEIYRGERKAAFRRFLQEDAAVPGARRSVLSAPPVYTLTEELAIRILGRNAVPEPERRDILAFIASERERVEAILAHSPMTDVLPEISEEEYGLYPASLPLSGLFDGGDILCTYEEYREHLALCEAFAAAHPGYTCQRDGRTPFRNIQITVHGGQWALVSKNRSPAIHFVIRHPKIRDAIENMVVPVTE